MPSDDLVAALSTAQGAPLDDYMVSVTVRGRDETIELPLETVRLPMVARLDRLAAEIMRRAKNTLTQIGFEAPAIAGMQWHVDPLPSREELTA